MTSDSQSAWAASVALSTASVYPMGCAQGFELAAALGYDGVEVMVWNDSISQDVAKVRELSKYHQLPVVAIHAPTLLVTQRVWGKDPVAKLQRSCQMAVDVGAPTVVVHPPFRWQREYAAQFVETVATLEEEYGVAMAVENMYPWRARRREMQAYLPEWNPVPQPYAHVTIDLSHAATAGSDALAMVRELGRRLTHLHLADGTGLAKDEHLIPGRGTQPCAEVLQHLQANQWQGSVVVEVNTRRCRTSEQRAKQLQEALTFARVHLGQGHVVQSW